MRVHALGFFWFACMGLLPGVAHAYPTYVDASFPPAIAYECNDCHVHPSGGGSCNASTVHPRAPCLNPFGRAFRSAGSYAAVASGDTDGDGTSNGTELNTAARSAGLPRGAETVGCNMLTAATFPGTWIDCGSSNVQILATFSTTGTNNYILSYRCVTGTSPATSASDTLWTNNCLDPNECSGNPCSPGSCAQRSIGSGWSSPGYDCTCPAGYTDSGTACTLTDACAAGTDTCVAIATCVDTPGSSAAYTCNCPHAGYTGNGRSPGTGCTNINECATNPCGSFGTGCTERPLTSWSAPGYTCTCQTGYAFNGTTCVLADECTAGLDNCHPVAICMDRSMRSGDWTCTCPAGYTGTGVGPSGCLDIDECRMGLDDCDGNATCRNTPGSFTCSCNSGYAGDGRRCSDIDECMDPVLAGRCDPNSRCTNRVGSYACVCNAGYRGDGLVGCSEIDECAEGSDDCAPQAICTNTPGSWSCACDDGWVGDGRTCADVDECLSPETTSRCSTAARCENLPGDWHCVCGAGYVGDGFVCDDVDECEDGTDTCDPNASCENIVGGFTCTCLPGFRGSGFECLDIDECAESTDGCDTSERCINQIGTAPLCVCLPGLARNEAGDCVSACGDGSVGRGELCDDGNVEDGDGCNADCRVERGWSCYEPEGGASTCLDTCGDRFVDLSEECDDGDENADAPDACRTDCSLPACGDGIVDTGEGCDEGDANDDGTVDGCRTTCREAFCGDGVVDTGELCDPGELALGDPTACLDRCGDPGDAGPDTMMEETPTDGGCSCRATPSSGAPWSALLLGLLGLVVRRRRASRASPRSSPPPPR
ncbi:MAG: hypothetical protein H6719_24040 [Sandaracinaceae bacterium]|nr:hypothetical protein [Sandaracinaceae bacterium]